MTSAVFTQTTICKQCFFLQFSRIKIVEDDTFISLSASTDKIIEQKIIKRSIQTQNLLQMKCILLFLFHLFHHLQSYKKLTENNS